MPRRRSRHPNWPYRLAWLSIFLSVALYLAGATWVGGMTFGHRNHGTDWWMVFVASCLDLSVASWFLVLGASIGSFLNVVVYRLPLGRTLGGHSGCPYCCSAIEGRDNVPVLAWLKLRGRCRNCHLPISPQYPLVEFLVAIVFLAVFFTELGRGEANLPGHTGPGGGLFRLTISSTIVMRQVSYLVLLCSLVTAGLITLKRQFVPLKLFAWGVLPLVICSLVDPGIVIVPWRKSPKLAAVDLRLDVLVTLVCGMVTAIAVARLLSPILYRGLDRSLLGSDAKTSAARAWIGGLAISGALIGWQAVVPLMWVVVAAWCVGSLVSLFAFSRFSERLWVGNPAVWIWLGLLCFRASWRWINDLQILPLSWSEISRHVVGAILLAPVCALLIKLLDRPFPLAPEILPQIANRDAVDCDDDESGDEEEDASEAGADGAKSLPPTPE